VYTLPDRSASDDFWAAGSEGKEEYFASLAHWNGSAWSRVLAPDYVDSFGSQLNGVVSISSDDAWAVGDSSTAGEGAPLTEHFAGGQWQLVATPDLQPSVALSDVTALGRHRVWAVGRDGERPLIVRWDGHAWSSISLPNRWTGDFAATTSDRNGHVWAVGSLIARRCPLGG
jgi:hypothetical protein